MYRDLQSGLQAVKLVEWVTLYGRSGLIGQKVGEEQHSLTDLQHPKRCGGAPLLRKREQAVNLQCSVKESSNILSVH